MTTETIKKALELLIGKKEMELALSAPNASNITTSALRSEQAAWL